MKKLFIHIGLRKTGTSSIQVMLTKSQKYLNSCGFQFPDLPEIKVRNRKVWKSPARHNCLAASYADYPTVFEKPTREEVKNFWEQMLSSPLTSIISAESFSRQIDFTPLAQDIESFQTDVIVYIRRQDKLIESLYNQRNKLLSQRGNSDFIDETFLTELELINFMNRPDNKKYLNYLNLFQRIKKTINPQRLIIRKFDKNSLISGNVTTDICRCFGVDSKKMSAPEKEINRSIGNATLKEWKQIALTESKHAADKFIKQINIDRNNGKDLSGSYKILTSSTKKQILSEFREINEKIHDLCGVDLST